MPRLASHMDDPDCPLLLRQVCSRMLAQPCRRMARACLMSTLRISEKEL
jgi:hypothetical protein